VLSEVEVPAKETQFKEIVEFKLYAVRLKAIY